MPLIAKNGAEVLAQRVQPDVLDGQDLWVEERLFAATGGLPAMDPVGGLITGAAVAGGLHESLQEHRPIAIALLPIVRELPSDEGEDFRGQSLGLDPRQDQEACVVDHERQIAPALRLIPADETLARGEL